MSAKEKALLTTQFGVMTSETRGGVADMLYRGIRSKTFNGSPHLGAGIIASELRADGIEVSYFSLEKARKANWQKLADKYNYLLFSAIDVGTDVVGGILEQNPALEQKSILGGQAFSAIPGQTFERFPEAVVVHGRAEPSLSRAIDIKRNGGNGVIYETQPYDLKDSGERASLDPKYTFRKDPWFKNSGLKLIELSTGCSTQGCDFCPLSKEKVTIKPEETAFAEMDLIDPKPLDVMVVVDHNIFNLPPKYLSEYFDEVNQRGINWAGEGTIMQGVNHPDVLEKMGKNCISMLVGLEDIDGDFGGAEVKRKLSQEFPEVLKLVRKVKLPITWSMVFPLENHTRETFLRAANFIKENRINVNMHLTQPRLGSSLRTKLESEDRLLPHDSLDRDGSNLVFEPNNMTVDEALAGYIWLKGKVASWTADRYRHNLQYGLRYATALATLDLTADGLSGLRLRNLHPELSEEIKKYEKDWKQKSF